MSLRTVAALAGGAAVLLAPAAHASEIRRMCAEAFGPAVPAAARGWHCVGTGSQKPGCADRRVYNPNTGSLILGVEECGVL